MANFDSAYREIAPLPPLRPFVKCLWQAKSGEELSRETMILPDGSADLIFAFRRGDFLGLRVVGAMTRPLFSRMAPGDSLLGIRFQAGGAYPFFGLPLRELTDLIVDARDLGNSPLWKFTEGGIAFDGAPAIQRMLLTRLKSGIRVEPRIAHAASLIESDFARTSVAGLSESLNLSRQHLKRLFDKHTGLGPAKFIRVARLQALLAALERMPRDAEPDWADLAPGFGWYDQAHLINDFRELTGSTPGFHFSNTRPSPSAIMGT